MMMSKKWMTAVGALLVTGVLATGVAFAATGETANPAAAATKASEGVQALLGEIKTLREARMAQLKTDIEALIDKAAAEGKITSDEATKLKARGMAGPKGHFKGHRGEMKGGVKGSFMHGATEAEVKAMLDEKIKAGSITQEQADQMLQRWQEMQTKRQQFQSQKPETKN